jgi:peptidoglycan-N-acetylglucosamine deacetylase
MNKGTMNLFAFAIIALISIGSIQNPYTTSYVDEIKQYSVTASKQKDPLYLEIQERADTFNVKPQDAKIDPIWKALPGYNGKKVDIDASYKKMKKDGFFNEKKLVYIEVKPKKHLADLPPAPIYRGHPDKHMVSFIINVAWGNEHLPKILSTLKEHNIHSTFFLEGNWVKKNTDLTNMLYDEGHELGNHSYNHPDMKVLTPGRIREQLVKTNEVIKDTVGFEPKWFAPPSGSYRDDVIKIADELHLMTIMWSVDTIDWKKPEANAMVDRVLSKVHPGAMILMHPTASTADGLQRLIVELKEKGYKIGSVSELLSESRVDKQ